MNYYDRDGNLITIQQWMHLRDDADYIKVEKTSFPGG